MKSCEECEYFFKRICMKKRGISKHRSRVFKEYFNEEVFYKNIFLGFDIDCPEFKIYVNKDHNRW